MIQRVVRRATERRYGRIERYGANARAVQNEQLEYLLAAGRLTAFGRERSFGGIRSYEEFCRRVDVADYAGFAEYVERARRGERSVLWPGRVRWFAKSSGTTGRRSKYIPVTAEGVALNHMRGMRDVVAMATRIFPKADLFAGRMLTLGGSHSIEREGDAAEVGDLSAILIEHTPRMARLFRRPSRKVALTADFNRKVEALCRECATQNITALAGVPSWNLVMLTRLLEYTGRDNISQVWPNLQLFVHGGTDFRPYREVFRRMIPSQGMNYMETYNASEGFFAMADREGADDMLLMLDYGTFYEFLPTNCLTDYEKAIPLAEVECGVEYAMIISNCNGLWRYMIGDTVEFTSVAPYRIRITGRTQSYINVFGEELVVDNAERAVEAACRATGADVVEYTVAPVYMGGYHTQGAHQWLVEFRTMPDSVERWCEVLDEELCRCNSDYDAKRQGSATLLAPVVTILPRGTFMRQMTAEGRLGGQNKVPRLRCDRELADALLNLK